MEEEGSTYGHKTKPDLRRRKGKRSMIFHITQERERTIVNQTHVGSVLKAKQGKHLRDGVGRIVISFSERINTILN